MFNFEIIKLFLLINFINLSSEHISRIYSRDGNLEFQVAFNKNISFTTTGVGSVQLNGFDLLKASKLAANVSHNINSYKSIASIAYQRMFTINDAVFGPSGILQRLKLLEGGPILVNSSSSITYSDLMPRIRRLTRRVIMVQRKLTKLMFLVERDECEASPCKNGGTCQDLFNNYLCICPKNWEGPNCDKDVNECAIFAGTDLGCQNGATCTNKPGAYECHCPQGYYGLHCTQRTLDCNGGSSEICGHGTCINQKNGIKCICDQGWTTGGTNPACTVDVNECALDHPKCSVNPPVSCINVPGSFYCGSCPHGYSGNGYYCADVNECDTLNGGCSTNPLVQCINTPGSRWCGPCPPGYVGTGESCSFQGNVCAVNNGGCHPTATCRANPHISLTFVQCICPSGYTGNGIGPNGCLSFNGTVNSCTPNPCIHGTCQSTVYGYYCICNADYIGRNCNVARKNPCVPNPCQNGGTCKSLMYKYYCLCPTGYRGASCQVQSYQACGGNLHGENGTIKYPSTNSTSLQTYISCAWYITTNISKILNVTFERFDIENDNACSKNWLQIHDGSNMGSSKIGRFCGKAFPKNGNLLTITHQIYIWLRLFDPKPNTGFELSWTSATPICEEFINVTSHGILKSPGSPGLYPNSRDCFWFFRVPFGNRIQFHFFSLEIGINKNCDRDYIAFKQTEPPFNVLAQYCNTSHPEPFTSPDSMVTVHFHSDETDNHQGFQISYSMVSAIPGCGGMFTKSTGQIQSPLMLKDSASDISCGYDIKLNKNARVKLTFLLMNFKSSPSCTLESLSVYEKNSDESSLIGRYCGDSLPAPISSNGNEIYLVFQTNMTNDNVGFQIYYEAICGGVFSDPSGTIRPLIFTDKCIYEIILQPGRVVSLNMIPENIDQNATKILNYCDYIEIRDGFNENSTLISTFCEKPFETIVTTFNHVVMVFKNFKGQSMTFNYTSIDIGCGGILKESKGTVSSTSFNEATKGKRYCNWVLLAPPDYMIRISWLQFNIEESFHCMYDYVQIFDNSTVENYGGSLGKFCGTNTPPTLMSTSNVMTVRYFMDESITLEGISFSYMFIHEKSVCGGTYFSNSGVIKSPGYPSKYPPSKMCTWIITVNKGQQVRLNVTHFELENYVKCAYDYLEIRSGTTASSPLLGKYCGTDIPNIIPAHSNQIYLRFKSDMSQTFSGFNILWDATTTGCGGTLSSVRGSIISPYYPEPYHNNALCEWKIIANSGSKINLVISDLDLEVHDSCKLDYIEVYNGLERTAKKIGRYCSANAYPPLIISNSSSMMVKFRSDPSMQGRGFNILYASSCNNTVSGYRGTIESPGFPDILREKISCEWLIEVPRGNKINITFSHYNLITYDSLNKDCTWTFIEIVSYDHEQDEWKSFFKYCDKDLPPLISVASDKVKLRFSIQSMFVRSSFRLEWSNFGCGGRLTHPEGTLMSPNFPDGYPSNTECIWIIDAGYGKTVNITFHLVEFENTGYCSYDYIEVYNGPDNTYPLLTKICHKEDAAVSITGSSNIISVKFESDSSFKGKGFNATYNIIDSKCGGTLSSRSGSIHSPNYPKNFEAGDMCEWLIHVPDNYLVNFTVTDVDFKNDENCTNFDYIKIYDGPTAAYPLLAKLCNQKTYVISTRNMMFVEMNTSYATKGFMANYVMACGSRIETQGSGAVNFSQQYMPDTADNCTFTIVSLDPAEHVHITFTYMSMYYSCYENITDLIVFDGETEQDPELGRFCGIKIPPKITSSGYAVHIVTTSSNIFSLSYSVFSSACGGTLDAWEGSFASPNYPSDYTPNIDCEWIIRISPGNRISLTFTAFNLVTSDYCNDDYLEIREDSSNGKLLGTFCGENAPSNITAVSTLWIFFRSNKRDKGESTASGFMADYQYVNGHELTGTSGVIASPLYPRFYDRRDTVSWQIMVRPLHKILLTFKDFYFDHSDDYCYSTTLNIFDGPDDNHPALGSFCGPIPPKPITTSSNLVYIVIENEMTVNGGKLLLEWKEVAPSSLTPISSLLPINSKCGIKEVIDLSNTSVYNLTSPGYPNGYDPNLHCEWIFSTSRENHLQIVFKDVAFENSLYTTMCITDYVSIYTGADGGQSWELLERICLPNATAIDLITSNYMKVSFYTDSQLNQSGFFATIFQICGGNLTEPNGIVSVTNLTNGIYSLSECQWTITVKPGRTIEIHFLEYDLEKDSKGSCVDYVLLKNGLNVDSPILGDGKYCGKIKLPKLQTTGKYAYIKYKSPKLKPFKFSYKEVSTNCGGEISLLNNVHTVNISSPNYPNIPNPNSECSWIIVGPPGESLVFDFIDRFDLTVSDTCTKEYVELRDGATKTSPLLGRYCLAKPSSIFSTDNVLFVNFFTDVTDPRNGFKAKISIAKCGGTVRGTSGRIKSPNYGNAALYPKNIECTWHIIGPHEHALSFKFDHLDLPRSVKCNNVYIEIYNANAASNINSDPAFSSIVSSASNLIGRFCTLIDMNNITSTNNEVAVKFVATDTGEEYTGFSLTFNSSQDTCGGSLEQPSGIVESPGYPITNHYNRNCEWKIKVPKGRRIKFDLLDVDLEDSGPYYEQGVRFFMGDGQLSLLIQDKEKMKDVKTIRTTENTGMIYFWSDQISNRRGFRISFSSDEPTACVGDLNQDEGTITQPMENTQYTCTWERNSRHTNQTIALTIETKFKKLLVLAHCKTSAAIKITTAASKEISTLCGTTEYPKTIRSPYPTTHVYAILSTYFGPGNFTINYKVHACGGLLSGEGYIRSPNYPNKLGKTVDCAWLITLPQEQRINITTNLIDLGSDCNKNYITIYSGDTPKSPKIGSFCKKQQITFTSSNNYLWIDYHGDESCEGHGFELKYEPYVTVCQSLSPADKILQSPSFPNRYPNNMECMWDITQDDGYHIGLEFERFQLEESEHCKNDYLEFLQYVNDEWESLGKYCGRSNPKYVNSTTNKVRVIFRTNDKVSGIGFRFTWRKNCGSQLVADSTKRYVVSPGYPNNYENDLTCIYNITSSGNINVDFEDFDIERHSMCEFDRLRVYTPHILNENTLYLRDTQKSYCGINGPGPIRNRGNIILEFTSDHWVTRKGFKFTYTTDDCGGVINQKEVKIFSPTRVNSITGKVSYMNALNCMWNITAPKDKYVVVSFTVFELEHQYNCAFDKISIYNDFTLNYSSRLATLCGNLTDNLPTIQSRGNQMLIQMKTDYINHYRGFEAYIYYTYGPSIGCGGIVNMSKTESKILQVASGYSMVDCHWEIHAPLNYVIKIELDTFVALRCHTNTSCACQVLEIRDGALSSGEVMDKFCISVSNKKTYFTSDRYGWIRYALKQGNTDVDNLKIKVSVMPSLCGERNLPVTKEKKYLTSPNYPNSYPDSIKCTWVLSSGKQIYLKFLDFDLNPDAKDLEVCNGDRLQIARRFYNSDSLNPLGHQAIFKGSVLTSLARPFRESTLSMGIDQFCGNLATAFDYYSLGEKISVTFYSGAQQHGKGFKIMYMTSGCNRNYTELQGRIFDHNPDENCHITINVPKNLTISIYFLNFYFIDSPSCNSARLEVKDLGTNRTLARLCGRSIPNPIFSFQNSVSIHVWTKRSIAGFYDLLYTTTSEGRGCGGFLYNYFGRFTSPLYPGYYQKFSTCTWEISVPQGLQTELTFTTFNMPNDCETDYVSVTTYDGDETNIHKFCGDVVPATLRSNNRMTVVYVTSNSNSAGWVAYFAGVNQNSKLSL